MGAIKNNGFIPLYEPYNDNLLLKSFLANYSDYSTTINNKKLFIDRKHLNEKGTQTFTDIIIQDHFDDK